MVFIMAEHAILSEEQVMLQRLVGQWKGTTTVQFGSESQPVTDAVSGTMRAVLGGRFILHEYTGGMNGKPLEGLALYGYNKQKSQYVCAWVDSFHNGDNILFSVDTKSSNNFSVLGGYDYTDDKGVTTHFGWRTTITMEDDNAIVIRMDNIMPDGSDEGYVETMYHRKK